MVAAAAGSNANEKLMEFASNLTIDNEEYDLFNKGQPQVNQKDSSPKLPVHASTQEVATQQNFDRAADRNNFDMLALFGQGMERAAPGQ
jgi:C1A family cysteine protease